MDNCWLDVKWQIYYELIIIQIVMKKLLNVHSMINYRAKLVAEGKWCYMDTQTHISLLRLSFIRVSI